MTQKNENFNVLNLLILLGKTMGQKKNRAELLIELFLKSRLYIQDFKFLHCFKEKWSNPLNLELCHLDRG